MGAHIASGAFYGYRELDAPEELHKRLVPRGSPRPPKLTPVMIERLGVPGYDYFAENGAAPATYPATWTELPWSCRMAKWFLRGGPIEVQISYDGSTVGDTRVIRQPTTTLDSFLFFRVRELVPGFHAWYQIWAML